MYRNSLDSAGAVQSRGLVQRRRDLAYPGLVEQGVERDEAPADDEDADVERAVRITQPVAAEETAGQHAAHPEIRVEQRLERDADRCRGEQQGQEREHGEHRPISLPPGHEHAEQQRNGCLEEERHHDEDPRQAHRLERDRVGEHHRPFGQAGPGRCAQAVPVHEREHQHPEQRHHCEGAEEQRGRQHHEDRGTGAPASRRRTRGALPLPCHGRDGHSFRVAFIAVTNCSGAIWPRNTWLRLVSSSVACCGGSA